MTVNKALRGAPRSSFNWVTRDGVAHSSPSASRHDVYNTNGYVGPMQKPSKAPLIMHPYRWDYDRVKAYRTYRRTYTDGLFGGRDDVGQGDCLALNALAVTFFPPPDFSNTYARALDKLNDMVRGNMDVSVDLAQGRQVLHTLKATERVRSYTETFFKKRFGAVRLAAELRLEYMYGVKPLMQTCFDAADEMIRKEINKVATFRARATDRSYRFTKATVQMYWGPQEFTVFSDVDVKLSTTLTINQKVTDNHWDMRRWSSLNPFSIAYELMPYSFVLDWFYDLGGYIRNMETVLAYGFDFNSGCRSDLAVISGSAIDNWDYKAHGQIPWGLDTHTASFSCARFNRYGLQFYPSPQPPRLQADLGSSRLLNAASLLGNFLSGKDGNWRQYDKFTPNLYRERVNNSINIKYRK